MQNSLINHNDDDGIQKMEGSSNPYLPIGKIIRQLMNERGWSEAELCRAVDVPQTTINRLLSCQTNDPRISTLNAIAECFKIKIEQLLGLEPLAKGVQNSDSGRNVPVVKWMCIRKWLTGENQVHKEDLDDDLPWISTERKMSDRAFALKAMPFMEAHFPLNALILVEPKRDIQDGAFVVISLSHGNPTVRKVIKDGNSILLRKVFTDGELREMTTQDTVLGTIVETRVNYGK